MDSENSAALESPLSYRLTLYVFGTVIFVLVLFMNLMLFVLVVRYPRLRTPPTVPVVSWGVLDLVAGLLLLSLMALDHLATTPRTSYHLCKFWACLQIFPLLASSTHLFILALDRYVAVMWPLRYAVIVSGRRMQCYLAFTWIYGLLMACIPLVWNWRDDTGEQRFCNMSLFPRYYPALPLLHTVGMVTGTFVIFFKIFTHIRRHQRQVHVTHTLTQEQLMADHKVAKVFLLVGVIFVVTWFPYLLTWFLTMVLKSPSDTLWMCLLISYLVGTTNSASKMVVYCIFHDDIQTSIKELYAGKPNMPVQRSIRGTCGP